MRGTFPRTWPEEGVADGDITSLALFTVHDAE